MIPVHVAAYLARLVLRLAKFLMRIIGSFGRLALRFLAYVLLLVAVIALVADLTPALNGVSAFSPTPFAEHIGELAPQSLVAAETTISQTMHPWVWDYGVGALISLPTFLLFGLSGGWAAYAGRRRRLVDVFSN